MGIILNPGAWTADLHIHSHYSRATARDLNPGVITRWAARKGLTLVGTGDLTHAGWLAELEESLEPAPADESGDGLFRLKGAGEGEAGVRFVLSGEVSCIYKQGDRTRKVHLVILMPGFEAARRFNAALEGAEVNLVSDGRPIMGLPAVRVLDLALRTDPQAEVIPAHIWTPWFSVLGSKSGFESLEECFLDLSPEIHAVETGLSSDPPMNWRVSSLDRYFLTSSSDAHSPSKLGREATLFSGPVTYSSLIQALRTGQGLEGTLEFFPEEGKYHLDGHRKCRIRLEPGETKARNGICPVCGKPVTVGVLNRVEHLADRTEPLGGAAKKPFESLISLCEIISQAVGVGPTSKKVAGIYREMLAALGPELEILRKTGTDLIQKAAGPVIAEGVSRVRAGRVRALGGYDGQFGTLSLFTPDELAEIQKQGRLFAIGPAPEAKQKPAGPWPPIEPLGLFPELEPLPPKVRPDPDQEEAVMAGPGPVMVLAGPGGGKTGVLVRRTERLLRTGSSPERVLILTFTRKAAQELKERLSARQLTAQVETFHSLGLNLLKNWGHGRTVLSEEERLELIQPLARASGLRKNKAADLIAQAKLGRDQEGLCPPLLLKAYGELLKDEKVFDYEDLIALPLEMIQGKDDLRKDLAGRFDHILVDEFQDLSPAQYRWLDFLAPDPEGSLTVVGDPDQSIYGFRGGSPEFFGLLARTRPALRTFELKTSYRCSGPILSSALSLIRRNPGRHLDLSPIQPEGSKIISAALATPRAEAVHISQEIERLLGGTSHLAQAMAGADGRGGYGLAEIAVLFRLHRQAEAITEALDRTGLPFQLAGTEPGRETDGLDLKAEKITLLTFHAAKGLEFPVVFLTGLEEGLLPYNPPGGESDPEEERRLLFVALTRARERLILTRSATRTLFGRKARPGPSPFLAELPPELVDKVEPVRPPRRHIQGELF